MTSFTGYWLLDATPHTRRLLNQALFERFVIDDTEEITGTFREPFDLLIEAAGKPATQTLSTRHPERPRGLKEKPRGSSYESLVELVGLEPTTSWVRYSASTPGRDFGGAGGCPPTP